MEQKLKCCKKCNKTLPKTSEYFYQVKYKRKNSKGDVVVYYGFKSYCKSCHKNKTEKERIARRCKEMNCELSEYENKWKEQYSKTRTVDLDAKANLTSGQYGNFKRLVKKGFNINYKDYLEIISKSKKERNKRLVDNVASKKKYFTKEDIKTAKKNYFQKEIDKLSDSYIANHVFKKKIEELTPEIIEAKRLIIKLKRELKNNNIKIN